jgi:hypothetical protein
MDVCLDPNGPFIDTYYGIVKSAIRACNTRQTTKHVPILFMSQALLTHVMRKGARRSAQAEACARPRSRAMAAIRVNKNHPLAVN